MAQTSLWHGQYWTRSEHTGTKQPRVRERLGLPRRLLGLDKPVLQPVEWAVNVNVKLREGKPGVLLRSCEYKSINGALWNPRESQPSNQARSWTTALKYSGGKGYNKKPILIHGCVSCWQSHELRKAFHYNFTSFASTVFECRGPTPSPVWMYVWAQRHLYKTHHITAILVMAMKRPRDWISILTSLPYYHSLHSKWCEWSIFSVSIFDVKDQLQSYSIIQEPCDTRAHAGTMHLLEDYTPPALYDKTMVQRSQRKDGRLQTRKGGQDDY